MISSFDYRYNDIGNQVAVGKASGDRVTWTYDDTSQLTSEHHSGTNAFRNTFTLNVWDYENRMTSVQLADASRNTMTYQPDGLRVKLADSTGCDSP